MLLLLLSSSCLDPSSVNEDAPLHAPPYYLLALRPAAIIPGGGISTQHHTNFVHHPEGGG